MDINVLCSSAVIMYFYMFIEGDYIFFNARELLLTMFSMRKTIELYASKSVFINKIMTILNV